ACAEARKLLAGELAKEPDHHWLLTQIGVTLYEQRRYAEALRRFVAALEIVADCPLTLWNLAGTLDAMGKPAAAIPIYSWLLESDRSPADDACWESREWTDALKTDCVYRLGVCLQHLGKKDAAGTVSAITPTSLPSGCMAPTPPPTRCPRFTACIPGAPRRRSRGSC